MVEVPEVEDKQFKIKVDNINLPKILINKKILKIFKVMVLGAEV
jgi:hypothetical protein